MVNAVLDTVLQHLLQGVAGVIYLLRSIPSWILAGMAWAIATLVLWNLYTASRDTVKRSQTMHQIPCAGCQFFTHDYRLKCTVHPSKALTEAAIGCHDFEAGCSYIPPVHSHHSHPVATSVSSVPQQD